MRFIALLVALTLVSCSNKINPSVKSSLSKIEAPFKVLPSTLLLSAGTRDCFRAFGALDLEWIVVYSPETVVLGDNEEGCYQGINPGQFYIIVRNRGGTRIVNGRVF